jgi:hypothetical protein
MPDEATQTLVCLLEDIESIKRLKARYFRCVDERAWSELRTLFTDDCTFHSAGSREIEGPDAFIRRVAELIHPGTSVHQGHMPEYVEVDPDRAGRRGLVGHGHYYENYRREARGWVISRWDLRRTRVTRIAEGGLALLSASSSSATPTYTRRRS